nr:POTE ankyrin domain family member F isoform X4 [Oryctolagus cuniculus]
MVKFLILQNADVFAVDNLNRTSLMFAGRYSTENIVHMLLELGVDVLSEDIAGHSARDYALQKRNMQNYQLISLFRENAALEKIVNTNPDDEHSKEYRKRLLEIPDVNHELLISYEKGLNSFAKKDLIPGHTTAIIHSAPEEQPNNDRITRVHGVHEDNKCGAEDEAKESTSDPEEGMSTLASKKGLKDIAITQVAPQQPINEYAFNYDRGLDNGNMGKESTSQRDPEDNNSPRNSKEESSAEPLKREEVPISGISDEAVESPWDSEEETSSGKGEGRAATGGVPEGDILDYFLSCSWARIAKERKASMASSGDTEKDVAVSLSAQEHAKDTLSGIAGVPEDKTIDMPGFRPDDEPLKYSLKSETISTNSWKESINQSMAADAKGKDMNEPLEEFAKGSTELTPRLEAIHPFLATSVGMNEVQTCRQVTGRIKLKPIPKHLKRHFLPHCNTNQYKSTELELKNVKSSPTNNDIKTAPKEEQEWLDGSENKQFEEQGQRCQSKEMEGLRNLHESAAPPEDSDGCGLNQQRQSGDLDNQQSATKKSEEYYS